MKHFFLTSMLLFVFITSYSQLKVHSNGSVSMGSTTLLSSSYNLTLGETWGNRSGILHKKGTQSLRVGQASETTAVIGTTTRNIAFWYSSTYAYNDITVRAVYETSDRRLKSNIKEIKSSYALDLLLKLKSYSYNYKSDLKTEGDKAKLKYGFIAQEVKEILPDVTDTLQNTMVMDYNQITPLLVSGYKELNNDNISMKSKIDSLNQKIIELEGLIKMNGLTSSSTTDDGVNQSSVSKLFQNTPNPFNEITSIKYEIDNEFINAKIIVFDMNGKLLVTKRLKSNENKGEIKINSNELYPGMFMYSLVVENELVDTKKMILTK